MGTTIKSREYPFARKETAQSLECPRRAPSNLSSKGDTPFAFLNKVIPNIPAVILPVCTNPFGQDYVGGKIWWTHPEGNLRIDAGENIDFLVDSVKAYCKVYNAEFRFEKSDRPLEDLRKLYSIAVAVKPESSELALDYQPQKNMVIIREFAMCDFDYSTLFFLPVSFVKKLPIEVQPTIKKLLGVIISYYDFQLPEDHMDMSFALGMWDEGWMLEEMKEEDPTQYLELKDIIDSYQCGEIAQLIKECTQCVPDVEKLVVEAKSLSAKFASTYAGRVLDKLVEGITMQREGSWPAYTLSPDHCIIEDYDTHDENEINYERLFAVVYDLMDEIVERATECINADASLGEAAFYDNRELTPDITTSFVPTDHLKRWCIWFEELTTLILRDNE